MLRLIYNLLQATISPFVLLWLTMAKKDALLSRQRWYQYLGLGRRNNQPCLWVHAVSLGEVIAAAPLIKKLQEQAPHINMLVTTLSNTGAVQVSKALGNSVEHRFIPLDTPWTVNNFLHRTNPQLLMIMETELWPNLLAQTHRQGIPIVLSNARLSSRSATRYAKFQQTSKWLVSHLDKVLAQHQDDSERFLGLGVSKDKLVVTGSIKFDISLDQTQAEQGYKLKKQLNDRPVLLAASTHSGEEEKLLAAFKEITRQIPEALLILVPRHPERFNQVAELVRQGQFTLARRSHDQSVSNKTQVYLGDSMGEMMTYIAMCDLVFMGGSLVPIGGHNVLEPAALGKPCIIGPNFFNFKEITNQLQRQGHTQVVDDEAQLTSKAITLLQDKHQMRQAGESGRSVVEANRGALDKSIAELLPYLDKLS